MHAALRAALLVAAGAAAGAAASTADLAAWIAQTFWHEVGAGGRLFVALLAAALVAWIVHRIPAIAPGLSAVIQAVRGTEGQRLADAGEAINDVRVHGEITLIGKVADAAHEATLFVDTRARIRVFNRAAEAVTGYRAAEVIGVDVAILLDAHTATTHDVVARAYLSEREELRRPRLVGRRFEVTLRHKSGHPLRVILQITEVSNGLRGFWATFEAAADDAPPPQPLP